MNSNLIKLLEGEWVARYIPKNEELEKMGSEDVADDEFDEMLDGIEQSLESNYPDETLTEYCEDGLTPLKGVKIEIHDGLAFLKDDQGKTYSGKLVTEERKVGEVSHGVLQCNSEYDFSLLALTIWRDGRIYAIWSRIFWGINDEICPWTETKRLILRKIQEIESGPGE
jgi:hypothetical protein